jgi:RNA polymerase sigma-70 factor (ECF subfamily)
VIEQLLGGDIRRISLAAARRIVLNLADAEDAVQNAYLKILTTRSRWREEASAKTYFFHVVVNKARQSTRRSLAKQRSVDRTTRLDDVPDLRSDTLSIEALLLCEERRAEVHRAIGSLTESQRIAVHAYYFECEGATSEETARHLGISVKAMKFRLYRGRKALAKLV